MEDNLATLLRQLRCHEPDDEIQQCGCEHVDNIVQHADELLELANAKIHVFPLSEVKSCWFRLYTDASLVKAIDCLETYLQARHDTRESTTPSPLIDEAVRLLDMALIVAGGLGHEEMIHDLFRHLQAIQLPPIKATTADWPADDILPSEATSLPCLTYPVANIEAPTLDEFQQHMQSRKSPLLLNGILANWPALTQWKSLTYWKEVTLDGRRLIPVEIGRSYVDEGWTQKIMSFGEFLQKYILSRPGDDAEAHTGYLAQHDVLRQIPKLQAAMSTPDYCYLEGPCPDPGTPVALSKAKRKNEKTSHPSLIPQKLADEGDDHDVRTNIWFGPAWTISPLHHDPYHNILCQAVGKKYVRLYSPHVSNQLFPRSDKEEAPHQSDATSAATIDMSNTSNIDVAAIELSPNEDWDAVYPGISKLPYQECLLEAGQALYIPVGWWHYVRSCSVGISVSFWW